MIKGINQSGKYLNVSGGQPMSTYINTYSGAQGVGNIRYNVSSQNLEVYDGSTWHQVGMSYASVGMTAEAEYILDWAKKKMAEEEELKVKLEKYPALKDAHDQFETIKALVYGEENSGT